MAFGGYIGTTGTRGGPIDVLAVHKAHNAFLAANDRLVAATLEEVGEVAVKHAKQTRMVKSRTGAMYRGWLRTPAQHTALGLVVSFYSNVQHAFYQEFGTGLWGPSHDYIRPKRARYLRWVSGGVVHFAAKVKGVPPKYIGKTSWFQAGAFEGPKMFERALGRLAARF
jgi:hypothetical protein